MSSSSNRVKKITSMTRSELKSLIRQTDYTVLEPEQRIIVRGYAPSHVKIIHSPPPNLLLEAQARPFIPDWQQVSRGPAIEAPYFNEHLIIRPPTIDLSTLTNKPNSGQLLFDFILTPNVCPKDLIKLGETKQNKKDLIRYISSLDDEVQEEIFNKVFDPKTSLHFFFAVPRSFLFNTSLKRGSFDTLAKLRDALQRRLVTSRSKERSMDIFEPRPSSSTLGFNEAWESDYSTVPGSHAMRY